MKYKFEEVERIIILNAFDLKRYLKTLDKTFDDDYKKNFNAYYGVRRNEDWRKVYYTFFKKNKNNKNIIFEEIIRYLHNNPKVQNIEPSFSSKMLATINPDKPIWDKYVLEAFDLKQKKKEDVEKIEEAIDIYKQIEDNYKELLKNKEVQETIKQIRKILKEDKLTDTKILDYIIWMDGKEKKLDI